MVDAAGPEAPLGDFKPAAGAQDNIVFRYTNVGEFLVHMAVGRIVHGKHVHGPQILEPRRVGGHQDLRLLQVLGRIRVGLDHDDHDLAAGVAGTGDIMLLAVDDPLIPLEHGGSTDIGGVRGCDTRLGHSVSRADLALHQGFQPLLLLGLAAVLVQHFHVAGIRGGAVENLGGNVGLAHLFRQVGVLNGVEAGAGFTVGQEEVPQSA